jgi:hypothetical protein
MRMTRTEATRRCIINDYLAGTWYHVDTWNPGDGATRYAILPDGCYIFHSDPALVAVGYSNAKVAAKAFRAGYYAGRAAAK